MNILYLHTHDTGRCIGPYGFQVPTPALSALAEDSAVFRMAFCAAPTCSPSRAGLLTGRYPHQNGMWGLAHRGFSLNPAEHHLAAWLARNGFETALAGIQHEAEQPESLGYQVILGDRAYSMGKCEKDWRAFDLGNAQAAADYLRRPHDRPFFLSVGLFSTHRPFPVSKDSDTPDRCAVFPHLPDRPETRQDMAGFCESVRIADSAAGIVLDALKASGRKEDTLVLFTTDHGPAFPWMKCSLRDHGTAVSLIISGPGIRRRIIDAPVSHIDVFPTVCEAAGVPLPDRLEGASLFPLLRGETGKLHDEIFLENSFHVAYEPMRGIRTERYKYIRRFGRYPYPRLSNTDDSPSKQLLMDCGAFEAAYPQEALYDLMADPMEQVNLAGSADHRQALECLRARLTGWMERTGDPLLAGPMRPGPNALVNPPQSLSPSDKRFLQDTGNLD